jgi:hypothetical protein
VKIAGAKSGVTPPILNSGFVSWYSVLYEVRHCHAAGILEVANHYYIFKLLA